MTTTEINALGEAIAEAVWNELDGAPCMDDDDDRAAMFAAMFAAVEARLNIMFKPEEVTPQRF